ncbi:MAG: copper resistance D family protein, partial [Actinomadura sp.]
VPCGSAGGRPVTSSRKAQEERSSDPDPAVRQAEASVLALIGVGVLALAIGLWLGDELSHGELPPGFVDPGIGTNVGLPLSRMIVDLSAIGTVGMLVTGILLPRTDGRLGDAARRSLRSAAWLAPVWGVATVVWLLFYWSDLLAVPVARLPASQLLRGTAISFPEAREFLLSAALALAIGVVASVTRTVWVTVALLLVTGYNLLPFTTSGHAEHSPVIGYALTAHVIALALWIGGLTGLLVHARSSPALLAVAVPRFSALALACYVAVGASGVTMGWLNLGSLAELWSSRYGLLVLCLLTAQVALGVFGWWHRRVTVRAVAERHAPGAFIRLAAAEVVIMVAAVAFGVALSRVATPATGAAAENPRPHVVAHQVQAISAI